jgi:hypothetical protein
MLDYVVKIAVVGLVKRRDASVIYQILAEMKIAVELKSYWVGTQTAVRQWLVGTAATRSRAAAGHGRFCGWSRCHPRNSRWQLTGPERTG